MGKNVFHGGGVKGVNLRNQDKGVFRRGFLQQGKPFLAVALIGPLRLRVQSRSRTRLRIAASIAVLFRACFGRVLDTIAPQSRG